MSHGFLGKSVAIHKNDQNDSVSTLGCGHEPVLTGFEAGFSKQSFLDSRKKFKTTINLSDTKLLI